MTEWLNVQRLDKTLPLISYQTEGAAGLDLFAAITCKGAGSLIVPTGVAVQIPRHHVGLIRSRSGLGFKQGIEAFHGTIDEDYRGEIKVRLTRKGIKGLFSSMIEVQKGDRIAQLIIVPCAKCLIKDVNSLEDTKRGLSGFGSTG